MNFRPRVFLWQGGVRIPSVDGSGLLQGAAGEEDGGGSGGPRGGVLRREVSLKTERANPDV